MPLLEFSVSTCTLNKKYKVAKVHTTQSPLSSYSLFVCVLYVCLSDSFSVNQVTITV